MTACICKHISYTKRRLTHSRAPMFARLLVFRRHCCLREVVWSSIHDIAVFDEPFHVWSHGLFGAARNDCFIVEHDSDTMASRNVVRHGQVLSFGELLKQPGWCDAQFTFVGGRIRALQCAALCQPHLVLSLMLQQRWTPLSICGKVLTARAENMWLSF